MTGLYKRRGLEVEVTPLLEPTMAYNYFDVTMGGPGDYLVVEGMCAYIVSDEELRRDFECVEAPTVKFRYGSLELEAVL